MARKVYLENWHTWLVPTIDDVLMAAGKSSRDSAEEIALLAERNALEEMIRQVRDVEPGERVKVSSPLLACMVHGACDVPASIVERVGEIHDIYRRFRNRLVWNPPKEIFPRHPLDT